MRLTLFLTSAVVLLVSLSDAGNVITGKWKELPGKLTKISIGDAGIWGVNRNDNIYQYNWESGSWNQVSGKLVQIASGKSIWGVNRNDYIYRRNVGDSSWTQVAGRKTQVDVSNNNRVWAVNRQDKIYRWLGGNDWQQIDGGAKQVTVGESGVWHLNGNGNMWYRAGTYGDVDTAGYGWDAIDGTMKWISSGKDILVGVDRNNEIYYRSGMSPSNPTGDKWVKVSGSLMQIEIDGLQTVGVNSNETPYQSGATRGCSCDEVDDDFFDLENVDYDLDSATTTAQPPKNVGKKIIKNRSGLTQTTSYTVSRTVTETSSFSHTAGASVTIGTTFSVGVPFIAKGEVSVSATASYSYTQGASTSEAKTVSANFKCSGAAQKTTECDAVMYSDLLSVPFTRTWVAKDDSSCKCTDSGVFEKIAGHRLELEIIELNNLSKRK